jgi:hypothetical protein
LFAGWTWYPEFKHFLENVPSNLTDLKIVNAGFSLKTDNLLLLPVTLRRLMVSNRKKHDPNHSNRPQFDQSPVINPEQLSLITNRCKKLRLLMIETGLDRFGTLKIIKRNLERQLKSDKRICKIFIQNYSAYAWGIGDQRNMDLSDYDLDTFIDFYPEIRRIFPKILNLSTPFRF